MSEEGYILDVPLPLNQDFNALKDQGLAYIQLHSDYHWTNLNPSDPGVTILEQICYALTELGYCNDFPMQDILARRDGKLHIYDQFYPPETILTTSPVSVTDYQKYVIDAVTNVGNAVFLRGNASGTPPVYNTFLLITPPTAVQAAAKAEQAEENYVCAAAFVSLNKARNLCEIFTMPLPLKQVPYELKGSIEIESGEELNTIVQLINESISEYIFAPVIPKSYKQLLSGTETMSSIFDGPRLKNGWISTDMLSQKKDKITIYEIIQLIEAVPGVVSVDELHFAGAHPDKLHCKEDELIVINTDASYTTQSLTFISNGATLDPQMYTLTSTTTQSAPAFDSSILFDSGIDIRTDLPKSRYRDINSYYSIQNTFPDLYPVGSEFADSTAPDYQVAQSRQLIGYLTLFDQVLANQFSQLANVEQLFSFKNAMTGTPSDTRWYYAVKKEYNEKHEMYPVPYLRFSPTYFFQSLYDIRGIRPLLKGNQTFDFHIHPASEDVMEKIEWQRFRLDPYNPYIRQLMNMMEDEPESIRRRNALLDHLLARHGESSLMINAYINGSSYTNDGPKDRVIFKSLYLQNLGVLSYNRYKAYNYLQSDPFAGKYRQEFPESAETYVIRREFKKWIFVDLTLEEQQQLRELITERNAYYYPRLLKWILSGNTVDSVFDSEKVDALEKVTEDECRNFSGIELKLSLLFGLKVLYRDLLITGEAPDASGEYVPLYYNPVKLQALWLVSKRKGCIMVEMNLLQQCLQFGLFFNDGPIHWQIGAPLSYDEATRLMNAFNQPAAQAAAIKLDAAASTLTVDGVTYAMEKLPAPNAATAAATNIEGTRFSFSLQVINTEISYAQATSLSGPVFIFPDYLPIVQTYTFYSRLKFFLDNELPVNSGYVLNYADFDLLETLIPAFCGWHDSLVRDSLANYSLQDSSAEAAALLAQIIQTKPLPYTTG